MLKKYLLILMLMLPAITLVSCGNDDDETNGSDNDSNYSWVKVGTTKFSTKYSYVVLYDEGQYDNDNGYSIVCSDTDLRDYLEGKPFKKTISYIQFMYERNVGTSPLFGLVGCYKIKFDSNSEDIEYDKNGFSFVWMKDEPVCNPSGSSFKDYKSDGAYYFEGQSLKAAAGLFDTDDEDIDNLYGDLVDFSLSVKATPSLISATRSSQFEVVTDPDQIARLKKLLSK